MTLRNSLLAAAMVFALPSATAVAATTVFTGNFNNDWNDSRNWTRGVPTFDDDAIIPTGLTCIISTGFGEARTVEVQADATLGVELGFALDLWAPAPPNPPAAMTVHGTVYLKDDALLTVNADDEARLTGSGTINAATAEGYGPGHLGVAVGFDDCLVVEPGLTIKGSLTINGPASGTLTVQITDAEIRIP
jgi:hypothetical protein